MIVVATSSRIVVTTDEIIVARREVRMTVEMMGSVKREEPHASVGLRDEDQAAREKEDMAMHLRISSCHDNQSLPSNSRA